MDKVTTATVGVICLTAIEIVALLTGADGQFLSIAVGAIGTIVGSLIGYSAGKGDKDE